MVLMYRMVDPIQVKQLTRPLLLTWITYPFSNFNGATVEVWDG